ncbi:MAG: hypothetical protein [Olavius algarvensis Delta 4 endosymbiont]|nr:MAG: hypothetical protein [Olavius algarvensis Delta 4 endosymbiont]
MRSILKIAAQSKRQKVPTLKPNRLGAEKRELAKKGLCIECGEHPAPQDSYVCRGCLSSTSIEDIREEIVSLRQKILKK